MTSNTYTISDYSVTTSLFETSVYIRVVNNVSFQCFEDNVDISECKLPFNNKQIYDILSSCFNNDDEDFKVTFLMKKSMLNLNFDILFNGSFDVHYSFILKEMVMKADSKMTMNFHKLEADYNKKFEMQEQRIKNLEEIVECLVNFEHFMHFDSSTARYHGQKLNSLELNIYTNPNNYENRDNVNQKIQYYYQLNKLTINSYYQFGDIQFSNKTLKILIILCNNISTLQGLIGLPSLEEIEVRTSNLNNADNIIPHLHKNIKKITFFGGYGTSTKEKLIPYCAKNKIALLYA